MTRKTADLLQGTLDLLVLKTLQAEPLHGWAIAKRIQATSREVLQVNQGSLYPALYRLEDRGWVEARRGLAANGRRVKVYALTAAGRRRLAEQRREWRLFATAVDHVLAT